jgi:hypothetical protein
MKFGESINLMPSGLAKLASNRDLITTSEFAQILSIKPQTIHRNYCLSGEAYGVKPIKIGNRLLWSVEKIAERLRGAI